MSSSAFSSVTAVGDTALSDDACQVIGRYGKSVVFWPNGDHKYDPDKTLDQLIGSTTKLVVLGPGGDLDTALLMAETIDQRYPSVAVVLFANPTTALLERAMHYGVRGVLAPDAPQAELSLVIERAMSVARRRRDTEPSGEARPSHHIVIVLSPKGGAGKTTVTANVSAAIAAEHPGEVAVVDLDLQFGDIATVFGLEPQATIADLALSGRSLTSTEVKAVLTPDLDCDLYVLAAPTSPAEADDLTPEQVAETIKLLSRDFRWVVVDTPAGIGESTLEVLEMATDIMLVTSMDIPTVHATTKEVELLDILGVTTPRRHVILNRANSKVGLSVEEIERSIGLPIDVRIPSTHRIPLSINTGRPLVVSEPKSPAAKSMTELATRVLPAPVTTGGWLGRRKAS